MTQQKKTRAVPSLVLDTGELAEMVYKPLEKRTAFLVGKGDTIQEEERIEGSNGVVFVPYAPDNTLLSHRVVLLPSGTAEYGSTSDLRAQVRNFIHTYVDLTPAFEEAASVYVLFSWVYDDFAELPYLRVRGDFGSGKSRFLLTVGSLCYMPIFASGASTVAPLFRILDVFRGTLVLDEADFRFSDEKADMVKILNNGNAQGFPVLRAEVSPSKEINPTAFAVFGPKLIATRGSFEDRALESRSITEDLGTSPLRRDIPLNLPASFHHEADLLRRQLLLFRFRNRGRRWDLAMPNVHSLSPRVAQLFAPLLSTMDEPDVRQRVLALARQTHREQVEARATDPSFELLVLLIELASTCEAPLSVKTIAEAFALRADLDRPVTARYVGHLLRHKLFLKPERRHGSFVLPKRELEKLPALSEKFGLTGDVEDIGDVNEGVEIPTITQP